MKLLYKHDGDGVAANDLKLDKFLLANYMVQTDV